jgi:hypothetical protein
MVKLHLPVRHRRDGGRAKVGNLGGRHGRRLAEQFLDSEMGVLEVGFHVATPVGGSCRKIACNLIL